ncbi:hypothetical protein [Paraflavitalea speifideaquila]|uniref:hypothetical protein n=1 Tax=Paraflavitalea speifideaquila TaxID=3076558 RepID=UPI0028EE5895|nr:hypothetical protein [Paraflavitalea speifideiaquila]
MSATVFLLTPPFTQLNTPYPATAYLKGFLNTRNITAFQTDLGIEVTLALFSRQGLQELFTRINNQPPAALSDNITRIIALQEDYISTIDDVIHFYKATTLPWPTASANASSCPKPAALRNWKTSTGPLAPWAIRTKASTWPPCTWKTSPTSSVNV